MALSVQAGSEARAVFEAMSNLPLPHLVFNSFANNASPSEFTSIISFGTRPLAVLIMAPTIAKTFATALLDMVAQYERDTGSTVLTVQEIMGRIEAAQGRTT